MRWIKNAPGRWTVTIFMRRNATISDATTRFTKGAVSEVFKRFASAEINSLAFELSAPQGRS